MEYRRAVSADIETLTRLRMDMLLSCETLPTKHAEVIATNTMCFIEQGFHNDSLVVWVAQQNDIIVAMGGINFFPLPPNDWCPGGLTGYLGSLYTLPDYRNHGIAREIVCRLQQEAQLRACERVLLHATDMGKPLYASLGFSMSESTMAWYPTLARR